MISLNISPEMTEFKEFIAYASQGCGTGTFTSWPMDDEECMSINWPRHMGKHSCAVREHPWPSWHASCLNLDAPWKKHSLPEFALCVGRSRRPFHLQLSRRKTDGDRGRVGRVRKAERAHVLTGKSINVNESRVSRGWPGNCIQQHQLNK